jgi:hypothetical protein
MGGLAADASPLAAQAPAPSRGPRGWPAVRVTKWALLAVAAGFGAYALVNSDRAEAAYGALRAACAEDQARCVLGGDGRYLDARSERLFARSIAADRRARVGIIGGQVTLLGSAALFVYDLRNGRGPADIPYPSGAAPRGRRLLLGARVAF